MPKCRFCRVKTAGWNALRAHVEFMHEEEYEEIEARLASEYGVEEYDGVPFYAWSPDFIDPENE